MTPADVCMNSRRSNVVLMTMAGLLRGHMKLLVVRTRVNRGPCGAILFPKPLETIRQLRAALSLVCQPGDQQREGFGVTRDPQWSSVHRIESHVANQLGRSFLALRLVTAVKEAGFRGVASPFENVK